MDIEQFREYCLSLGEVTEKTPFGKFAPRFDSLLVFYVLDHMFCMFDMDYFTSVTVRTTPEEETELYLNYRSVSRPVNRAMKYWVQIDFNGDISDEKILSLTRRAYEIIKDKYSKKKNSLNK